MIYDQRPPEPARDAAAPTESRAWRPDDAPDAASTEDRYVAVDRIDSKVVTLAVAPWPIVDPATGRLDFGPRSDRLSVTVSLNSVQTRVDRDRRANGQLVRPIRPGDVLRVHGFATVPAKWSSVVDVTRSGRLAAKAALFSTAAPAPRANELDDYGLDRHLADEPAPPADPDRPDEPEPPPPGPVAYPAV
jgi:hypothetical protein